MSNFDKVIEFNKSFNVPIFNSPQHNITKNNTKLTKLRLDLITEEVQELTDAIKQDNFIEIVDALADILYVVYGAGCSFGIDLDKAFDLVHQSNMSKLCKTKEIAIKTVQWYKTHNNVYDSPNYKLSQDRKYYIVYNESTGKILKSIEYNPVDFSTIL